jgi:hypothetical protein
MWSDESELNKKPDRTKALRKQKKYKKRKVITSKLEINNNGLNLK